MKLLLCKNCQDIVRLYDFQRYCKCGNTGGRYLDHKKAVYSGEFAVPLGINNHSMLAAVMDQLDSGTGIEFTAFVISKNDKNFERED